MSDYTPTKDHIVSWLMEGAYTGQGADHRAEAFDAWLAEHDAKVRAEALRDAVEALTFTVSDITGYKYQALATEELLDMADRIEKEAGQ